MIGAASAPSGLRITPAIKIPTSDPTNPPNMANGTTSSRLTRARPRCRRSGRPGSGRCRRRAGAASARVSHCRWIAPAPAVRAGAGCGGSVGDGDEVVRREDEGVPIGDAELHPGLAGLQRALRALLLLVHAERGRMGLAVAGDRVAMALPPGRRDLG